MINPAIKIDDKLENLIITSERELSFSILKEFVGYKDSWDNVYIYTIPVYPQNCFAMLCLIYTFKNKFNIDPSLLSILKSNISNVPKPTCRMLNGNYIGIECPSSPSYYKLMSVLSATPIMRNQYRIPFSRLYDSYRILKSWKHIFLPSFEILQDLEDFVNEKLTEEENLKDIINVKLADLYSVHYGYQVKKEGFEKLKYNNASDLLFRRPIRYLVRSDISSWKYAPFGEQIFIQVKINEIYTIPTNKLQVNCTDINSNTEIQVEFYGSGYLAKIYQPGDEVIIQSVKIGKNRASGSQILSLEDVKTLPICPVYKQSPTNKVTTKLLTQCIQEIFTRFNGSNLANYITSVDRSMWELLYELHFPKNIADYLHTVDELAYIELLYLQLVFLDRKVNEVGHLGCSKNPLGNTKYAEEAINSLPFNLTKGQQDAINHFYSKLRTKEAEKMLLSADVGAGKTLCAQVACLYTVDSGYQAVLVGPTEILAQQLYNTFVKFISPLENKPTIAYLSGNTKPKEKKEILDKVASGEIEILIGTHSVLSVTDFNNLGLVVIDEQQKFGTEQRDKLLTVRKDGIVPDLISQTATPIPRSTALAFYGDIDLVTINEKPNNRLPIITKLINNYNSEDFLKQGPLDVWGRILSELDKGHQMFIVCPAVEEDSKIISVNKIKKMLSHYSSQMKMKELSGKHTKEQQNKILTDFRNKKFNVLIASSIIEVGIDIPDATIVLILGANRFGASQLHQIRGRVGRSDLQGYCFLVDDGDPSKENPRLKALVDSNDGFQIALADLSTRNQGDILGTRQSGISNLKFCDLADHSKLVDIAKIEAEKIYNSPYKEQALKDAKLFLQQEEEDNIGC